MKKLTLILTLTLSIPAFTAAEVPMKATCDQIADLARLSMEARQIGVPLRTMMGVGKDSIMADMLTEAYGTPVFTIKKNQDRAIQEFEDEWYLRCMKTYNL